MKADVVSELVGCVIARSMTEIAVQQQRRSYFGVRAVDVHR